MNLELLDIVMAFTAVISAGAVGVVCCVGLIVWLAGTYPPSEPHRN